ncbi:hypothetical protein [Flagellimonas allohymeniacidonis]|uniref:Uncharacterized protein n=1 Tax=Flagellimonas allohymeniacidonis TaxID=2517819 RepID=A0A4Q8QIW6_9FLAO|nr:hypothetical protein [Allomuricauda hymeniacidonis]TAI48389.1 hypothetical protein EW142_00865 [Allomuricauda hymeniacidonis]
MTILDKRLLQDVKKKIAVEANLKDTEAWSQKDFDFLSYFIEERSDCRLSVSTLKRIWSNDRQRLPHISTLDALTITAYGKTWQVLKSASLSNIAVQQNSSSKPTFVRHFKKLNKVGVVLLVAIPVFLILIGGDGILQKKRYTTKETANVTFGHRKTLENELPNTVVFTYDIEAIDANRFFLQQSWDPSRKVEIFKGTQQRTDIYYVPGYFTAKLFADDEIIKEMPVHVVYEDWFMAARQPMSKIFTFDKNLWPKKDYLSIDKETLAKKGIDVHKEFQLAYYYVKDFMVNGDNLTYKGSFKMDPLENVDCPIFNVHLQGTEGYYWIMIGNRGCGSELQVRVGDTLHDGKTQDLTQLTIPIYGWNGFEVQTIDKEMQLSLNGTEVLTTSYEEAIGDIMEISFFFNGLGMVDDIELTDGKGNIKFSDDFEFGIGQVP